MQLEYLDGDLRRLAAEPEFVPAGWSSAEMRHFLLVAQCASAAMAESDLLNLRVLQIRHDDAEPTASVRLSARRQLVITFKMKSTPVVAVFDLLTTETDTTK